MKNILISVILLIALGYAKPARAQKAYDVINYKTVIFGNTATLKLADGYLLASKISISSKYGFQMFEPDDNEPDLQGDLSFKFTQGSRRYKNGAGSWIKLKSLPSTNYSSKINATYWDGKLLKNVVFHKTTVKK